MTGNDDSDDVVVFLTSADAHTQAAFIKLQELAIDAMQQVGEDPRDPQALAVRTRQLARHVAGLADLNARLVHSRTTVAIDPPSADEIDSVLVNLPDGDSGGMT